MADDEKKKEPEEQLVLYRHLERLMVRLGEQDLRNEECQIKAKSDNATDHDRFQAERSHAALEMLVHETIELARGLALRARVPATPNKSSLN